MGKLVDSTIAVKNVIGTITDITDINQIYIGNQDVVNFGITVCVEPSGKTSSYTGMSYRKESNITIYIYVYANYNDNGEETLLKADDITETIESILEQNKTLDSSVELLEVVRYESGYIKKGNSKIRCNRLTVNIKTGPYLSMRG